MKRLTKKEWIKKATSVHGDRYDYSNSKYINAKTQLSIICRLHGEFFQKPNDHVSGEQNCPVCSDKVKLTHHRFVEKSQKIHGETYDYSLSVVNNNYDKVIIICKKHGQFNQSPTNHFSGKGCPICKESKGEKMIRNILEKKKIKFEVQKKFKECKYKNVLPFDFYLYNQNLLIEFDGQQHFGKSKGMKFNFDHIKLTDEIKNNFAKEHGIKLLRIPYTKINKIENILTNIT